MSEDVDVVIEMGESGGGGTAESDHDHEGGNADGNVTPDDDAGGGDEQGQGGNSGGTFTLCVPFEDSGHEGGAEMSRHQKLMAWQPPEDNVFLECIRASKIPGIKEAAKKGVHICVRLSWIFGVFICALICGFLANVAVHEYMNHPMVRRPGATNVPVANLTLPTFYMVPMASFRESVLQKAFRLYEQSKGRSSHLITGWKERAATKLLYFINLICRSDSSISHIFNKKDSSLNGSLDEYLKRVRMQDVKNVDDPQDNDDLAQIVPQLKEGMTNCTKMVSHCALKNKALDCRKMIVSTMTNMGVACAANKMPEIARRKQETLLNLLGSKYTNSSVKIWQDWDFSMMNFEEQIRKLAASRYQGNLTLGLELQMGDDRELLFGATPMSLKGAGQFGGISMVLNFDSDDEACPQFDSEGFKVLALSPIAEPDLRSFGAAIPPFHEAFVAVHPTIILADDNIRDIALEYRECYFPEEKRLEFFHHYTQSNCRDECISKLINTICQCVMLHQPKLPGTPLCNPNKMGCINRVREGILEKGIGNACRDCRPECSYVEYRMELSVVPLRQGRFSQIMMENPTGGTDTKVEGNKKFSIVHFFWGVDSASVFHLQEKYSFADAVGIFGGIVGLTNAISFIDLYKLPMALVTTILGALAACWQQKRRNAENEVDRKQRARSNWKKLEGKILNKTYRTLLGSDGPVVAVPPPGRRRFRVKPSPTGGFPDLAQVIQVQPRPIMPPGLEEQPGPSTRPSAPRVRRQSQNSVDVAQDALKQIGEDRRAIRELEQSCRRFEIEKGEYHAALQLLHGKFIQGQHEMQRKVQEELRNTRENFKSNIRDLEISLQEANEDIKQYQQSLVDELRAKTDAQDALIRAERRAHALAIELGESRALLQQGAEERQRIEEELELNRRTLELQTLQSDVEMIMDVDPIRET